MRHIELRLEHKEQRIIFQRRDKLAFYLKGVLRLEQVGSEAHNMVTAVYALDLSHRDVCVGNKAVGSSPVLGEQGISEARCDIEINFVYGHSVAQHRFILSYGIRYLFIGAMIPYYKRKLITAHACNVIAGTRKLCLG